MIETIYQYSQFMLLDTRTRHDTELLQAAYETIETLRRVARATWKEHNGADHAEELEGYEEAAETLAHIEQHAPWLLEEES